MRGRGPDRGRVAPRRRPLALAVPAVAVALGALATVQVGGASVAVSWVDLACLGVLAWGAAVEVRRRRDPVAAASAGTPPLGWWPARREPALWAYTALLAVAAVQFLLPSVGGALDVEVATGASRFAGPAAALLGLTWLRPDEAPAVRGAGLPGRLAAGSPAAGEPFAWRVALVALGLVMAAGVLWDVAAAVGDPDLGDWYDFKRAVAQPVGVSNIIAGYTALCAWPALTLARRDRRWLPAAGVLLLATALTLSRGALLGMAVAAAVVALGRGPSGRALLGRGLPGRVLALAVAALTLAVTAGTIAADTRPGAEGAVASALRVRDEQYTAAWEAFLDAPLLGVGLNRFAEEVTVTTSQPSAAAVDGVIPYEHPNNAWLMALAEVGLLGAAAYLALWVLLAARVLRHPDPLQRAALAGAATGLAVHAQLEALTFTRGIEVLLALLLAAAWSPRPRDGSRPPRPTPAVPSAASPPRPTHP